MTDGDALTDADGLAKGTIADPGALATVAADPTSPAMDSGGGGGGGCFINTAGTGSPGVLGAMLLLFGIGFVAAVVGRK